MAIERVTERTDGVTTERTVERGEPTVVATPERSGGGMGGVLIAIAVIALLAVVGFFLYNMSQAEASKDDAVAGAASAVEGAADSIGEAAKSAGDAITPE